MINSHPYSTDNLNPDTVKDIQADLDKGHTLCYAIQCPHYSVSKGGCQEYQDTRMCPIADIYFVQQHRSLKVTTVPTRTQLALALKAVGRSERWV